MSCTARHMHACIRAQVAPGVWISGVDCDVASPASVQRLADAAASQMGSVDVWVNNAGYSGSFQVRVRAHAALLAGVRMPGSFAEGAALPWDVA